MHSLKKLVIINIIFVIYVCFGGLVFHLLELPFLKTACIDYAETKLNSTIEWLCRATCENCAPPVGCDSEEFTRDFHHEMVYSPSDLKKSCQIGLNDSESLELKLDQIYYKEWLEVLNAKDLLADIGARIEPVFLHKADSKQCPKIWKRNFLENVDRIHSSREKVKNQTIGKNTHTQEQAQAGTYPKT